MTYFWAKIMGTKDASHEFNVAGLDRMVLISDAEAEILKAKLEGIEDGKLLQAMATPYPKPPEPKPLRGLSLPDMIDRPLSDPYAKAFQKIEESVNALVDAVNALRKGKGLTS
jgi:hypothetical protein